MGDLRPGAISLDFPEQITLGELQERVADWVEEYGETGILQLDAGANNISVDVVPAEDRPKVQVYINSKLQRVGKIMPYWELVRAAGFVPVTNRKFTVRYFYANDGSSTKTLRQGRPIHCLDSMRFIITSKAWR